MIKSTTKSTEKSAAKTKVKLVDKSEEAAVALPAEKPTSKRVTKPKAATNVATEPPADVTSLSANVPRSTKQDQVLTLLAQSGGITINEVMRATGWQEHSVRGFFAGTVRKKLGFEWTSEKAGDDDRRYAIKVAA